MYVDRPEINIEGFTLPQEDKEYRIDTQTFTENWNSVTRLALAGSVDLSDPLKLVVSLQSILGSFIAPGIVPGLPSVIEGVSDFSFIVKKDAPDYDQKHFVTFNLTSDGFFQKPDTWSGKRESPGQLQQAISEIIRARHAANQALASAEAAKAGLDATVLDFERKLQSNRRITALNDQLLLADRALATYKFGREILRKILDLFKEKIVKAKEAGKESLPTSVIVGLSNGGDLSAPARAALETSGFTFETTFSGKELLDFVVLKSLEFGNENLNKYYERFLIGPEKSDQALREATTALTGAVEGVQKLLPTINQRLRELDDAQRKYQGLLAEADRIQQERQVFRQRAAAVIQGFRTRDAAFRFFRTEKLERYKTLFDLAAQYAFMAAQAFDYETGLLHTDEGQEFIRRIVRSRALGVLKDGEPQFAGSNTGDPGLSGCSG